MYTGEMAKFRLAPFGTVFSALKAMLDDFGGSNVDAVAELLDTAGRFLYRLPETHVRMANMADVRSAAQLQVVSCPWSTTFAPTLHHCQRIMRPVVAHHLSIQCPASVTYSCLRRDAQHMTLRRPTKVPVALASCTRARLLSSLTL